MNAELVRRIAESWAVPSGGVEHLLAHDETFREMWKELEQCREMVRQWRETLPRHLARIDEYSTLARELEAEIGRYLEQRNDVDAPN
jgi:hypothetical protein